MCAIIISSRISSHHRSASSSTSIYPYTCICPTAGSSTAIRETWHVASSADRSVSIGCRRFERHPVVVMSFVARLETVHAIFRHARSVYLSKSPDRLGWIARRSWRASRPINLLRHQPGGRSNVRFIELLFTKMRAVPRARARKSKIKRNSRARGKKSSNKNIAQKVSSDSGSSRVNAKSTREAVEINNIES